MAKHGTAGQVALEKVGYMPSLKFLSYLIRFMANIFNPMFGVHLGILSFRERTLS